MYRSLPGLTRGLALLVAVLVVGLTLFPLGPGAGSNAEAQSPPTVTIPLNTVTVTPTKGLTDGQRLLINLKGSPDFRITDFSAKVCRPGVAYQPSFPLTPKSPLLRPADFQPSRGNCPGIAISSSADVQVVGGIMTPTNDPGGLTASLAVGTGTVEWITGADPPLPASATLTCDETQPCTLVVELEFRTASGVKGWVPYTVELTYLNADPLAVCGGASPAALSSGGSSRMSDSWVGWTIGTCRRPGQVGALTRGVFTGEGESLSLFSTGGVDIAYTAAGYNRDVALVPSDTPRRRSVAVPIGINAAVIGVAGGVANPLGGLPQPYSDLRLTRQEVARLLAGYWRTGDFGFIPDVAAFNQRNPQMAVGVIADPGFFGVGAASSAEVTNYLFTKAADAGPSADWSVPNQPFFGAEAGRDRGITSDLALAVPSFNNAVDLFSARSSLREKVARINRTITSGGAFVLTDLGTANALSLVPAGIENATGQFVAPTADALAAAVPTLRPDENGLVQADLNATAAPSGASASTAATTTLPYPMTFVEYAMVPAEPLLDQSCAPRTASQKLLDTWLTYLTTDGQSQLSSGVLPLTPALAAEATAAIAKVGKAPVTGECAETAPPPVIPPSSAPPPPSSTTVVGGTTATTTVTTNTIPAEFGSGEGGGSFVPTAEAPASVDVPTSSSAINQGGGSGSSPLAAVTPLAGATTPETPRTTASTAPATAVAPKPVVVPEYAGARSPSPVVTVATLVLLVALVSVAAVASSGRRVRRISLSGLVTLEPSS